MAVYAIGDLQGCYDDLQRLLDHIRFSPENDTLWFAGDLVNRGTDSLRCLRFVKQLGKSAVTVLGNHDLSLLAVAAGFRKVKSNDTIDDILQAEDRVELLDWLRQQPLLHQTGACNYVMLHAGLPPQWTIDDAVRYAREAEAQLRSDDYKSLLEHMYGNKPSQWSDTLTGMDRWRFVINCFTRLRYCTRDGHLDMDVKSKPGKQDKSLLPWFEIPGRKSEGHKIVFGHWSTLGNIENNNTFCIDTGCIWGGSLTAMRLDSEAPVYFSVNCRAKQPFTD